MMCYQSLALLFDKRTWGLLGLMETCLHNQSPGEKMCYITNNLQRVFTNWVDIKRLISVMERQFVVRDLV